MHCHHDISLHFSTYFEVSKRIILNFCLYIKEETTLHKFMKNPE